MELERSEAEVDEQIDLAQDSITQGTTRWRGMTYEQGVRNALAWVTGDDDAAPMED